MQNRFGVFDFIEGLKIIINQFIQKELSFDFFPLLWFVLIIFISILFCERSKIREMKRIKKELNNETLKMTKNW